MTDVKIGITSAGTTYTYTLSPGCTITRSTSKDVTVIPRPEGVAPALMTLGSVESDTIRIDAKAILNDPGALDNLPAYVPVHTIIAKLIAQVNGDAADQVTWGSEVIFGRVKNIVVTQRPGEGDMYDIAINFIVGTPVEEI